MSEKECKDCIWAAYDPDGPYCSHPKSFEISFFGIGFNRMRANLETDLYDKCGPEGKFWEKK